MFLLPFFPEDVPLPHTIEGLTGAGPDLRLTPPVSPPRNNPPHFPAYGIFMTAAFVLQGTIKVAVEQG